MLLPLPPDRFFPNNLVSRLRSLPEGLRHATSLTQLVLDGNKDLERIPELPAVKDLFVTNCSSLKHVGNDLNVLENVWWEDEKLNALPSWLGSRATSSFKKLVIRTSELPLLQRLCPWDIGLDWPLIKDIPKVDASLSTSSFKQLGVRTSKMHLLQRPSPWEIGLDWPLIKDIPKVNAHLEDYSDCGIHEVSVQHRSLPYSHLDTGI